VPTFPAIKDGALLVYRQFDVAEDISLERAERLLHGAAEPLRLAGERRGFLDLPDRPLTVRLGPRTLPLEGGREVAVEAFVRVFSHGVLSARYEIPLPRGCDAVTAASWVRALSDSRLLEQAARADARGVAERLGAALDAPHDSPVFETYAVVFVRAFEDVGDAAEVGGPDLARVLLGEPPEEAVSAQTVEHVTHHRFSYSTTDLCVLDWDAALVWEPSGDRSVPDVLEVATAQLLEFRYYDALFEAELLAVTEELGRVRGALRMPGFGRSRRLALRLQRLVVETIEFVERVENAMRVVGDLYLARIYRAAVERFRIPAWQADVVRRETAALQVAGLLRDEASKTVAHVLEGSIVALIVLEIVLAFLR
jgi:hypothetical protein